MGGGGGGGAANNKYDKLVPKNLVVCSEIFMGSHSFCFTKSLSEK